MPGDASGKAPGATPDRLAGAPNIVRQLSGVGRSNSSVGAPAGPQNSIGRNQGTWGRSGGAQNTWGRGSVLGTWGRGASVFSHLPAAEPAKKIVGNPSDKAVFTFCNLFKDIEETRGEWPQLYIMCVAWRALIGGMVCLGLHSSEEWMLTIAFSLPFLPP